MKIKSIDWLYPSLVASMMVWGMSWPSAKQLTHFGAPIDIALSRFALTFLSSLVLLLVLKIKLQIQVSGWGYLLLAAVLMSLYSLCFFKGIEKGLPGAGGVLVTTLTPIFTYFLALLIAQRLPTKQESIGLLLGIIAACFLLNITQNWRHILQSGNMYFLFCCLLWTFLSRITAQSNRFGSPIAFSLWMYLLCTVFLFVFTSCSSLISVYQTNNYSFWFNLFFNAVINTGLATTFYFLATSKLGAAKTSSFIYIVPFSAAFFSWLFLNEKLL